MSSGIPPGCNVQPNPIPVVSLRSTTGYGSGKPPAYLIQGIFCYRKLFSGRSEGCEVYQAMNMEEWLKILATIFASIGLFFTAFQIRASTQQKRAQYVSDFLKSFWSDQAILEAYYLIEYSKFHYPEDFHGSDLEKKVDRLLECLGSFAKLHRAGLLPFEDLSLVRYEYLVVYQNEGIRKYIQVLDEWYKTRCIEARPFDEFRIVGEALEKRYYKPNQPSIPASSR